MDRTMEVALIGQPNVGKSSLFSRLTGVGVICSNYPGTTVEFDEDTVNVGDKTLHIRDLPGTYGLSVNSDDEKVVIDMIRDESNDVIVLVADATNLEASLVLAMEVSELNIPFMVALNKFDIASKRWDIDVDGLGRVFGVPFYPVSSKTGMGVDTLLKAISEGKARLSDYKVEYDGHIVRYVRNILSTDPNMNWGSAIKHLEGLESLYMDTSEGTKELIEQYQKEFAESHGEPIHVHIARDRYGDAHIMVMEAVKKKSGTVSRSEKLSELTLNPATGFPILAAVLAITLGIVIFLGAFLANAIDDLLGNYVEQPFSDFGRMIGGEVGEVLLNGIYLSLEAILGLVIPYIMVFYILLGILEDSGYLPRAVVLLDRLMHKIGLHGSGFIPAMVGVGCNVPAIMATRTIRSRRERVILCTLICLAIPCSAQLAIITGVTGRFAGILWALGIFVILVILGFCIGLILNNVLKHEPSNLAMELPELQVPKFKNVMIKMWLRCSDFFKLAVPMLIVGSIIVEILIHYNLLDGVVSPMSWLTATLLGLPAVTIIAFIVGIVRKEMAYGMLLILAETQGSEIVDFMTPHQFVIFGIVMSIYLPCLATMTSLYRELGLRNLITIALSSVVIAVTVGSIFNGFLSY